MSVDVIDRPLVDARICERRTNGARLPSGVRLAQVSRVVAACVSGQLGEYGRATSASGVPVFEYDGRSSLAQHEPGPIGREGATRGAQILLVLERQYLQHFPTLQDAEGQ